MNLINEFIAVYNFYFPHHVPPTVSIGGEGIATGNRTCACLHDEQQAGMVGLQMHPLLFYQVFGGFKCICEPFFLSEAEIFIDTIFYLKS